MDRMFTAKMRSHQGAIWTGMESALSAESAVV